MAGGMLVDDLRAWPARQLSIGTEGDLLYFVFPRTNGRTRLYLLHDIAQKRPLHWPGPAREVPGRLRVPAAFQAARCSVPPARPGRARSTR